MKTLKWLPALFLLALFLHPLDAQAGINRGLTFSPMLGGIMMEGDQQVDEDGLAFSLGVGYNFTKAFGLEAVLATANLDDADFLNYRLDALYHFMPNRPLVPYAALGIGGYELDSDNEFMANYGLGLLYFIADTVALRADVRHLMATNETNLEHNLLYTAGLKFQFASPPPPAPAAPAPAPTPAPVAPAPAAVPADSDGDGVVDSQDKCPDTPKGTPVDQNGCPRDSDGDGVVDSQDKCPDTPRGTPVDQNGCPRDSDGDGVFDHLDKCPGTPRGVAVDAEGCELKLTLHINFDTDKAVIKPEFKPELEKAAAFIKANANIPYVLLSGHTDSQGSDAYNQKLSERRAEAVRQELIKNYGIDAGKIRSKGFGESQPVADNATQDGRYQNRRVEVLCCTILPE